MKKKLYLFTESFSSDKREEFFEKELPFLCAEFEKVIVIPLYEDNYHLLYSNPKLEIMQFNAFAPCNRMKILFLNLPAIISVFLFEYRKTHNRAFYLKNSRQLFNTLILRVAAAGSLEKVLKKDLSQSVFYTYWFNQWTFILSLLKKKHPMLKLATRAHGSDYKEEQTGTTLPFRYFQLKMVNCIFPVSEYAKIYLHEKFNCDPRKIIVSRLGIENLRTSAPVDSDKLIILSCSSLIPLKRVHLIPQVLRNIKTSIHWVHFGSGPEMENIKLQCNGLPGNISTDLKGFVPNPQFLSFLSEHPVSFFLNVSEFEGIPVTLMEAISFGVPVIGTNVGGVSEIVNETTGCLIEKDFDPVKVASYIETEHHKKNIYSAEKRKQIQEFFRLNFFSGTNYSTLAARLAK
jgi:glycosyltransferase involved in cell wall biosynthesis